MRKIFLMLLILLIVAALSGCGASDDKIKIGAIIQLNTAPDKAIAIKSGAAMNFFDDFNTMQTALAQGNVNAVQVYGSVAKYMTANNARLKISENQAVRLVDDLSCAMREDDTALKNSFDAAIDAMKADGTLNALIDKYIDKPSEKPLAAEMPTFDGADTIKIGVTGDLPPLDFVGADGKPAGFNTAVLAEISKRIGKNFKLIQIASAARAVALTSKKVDVVFWVVTPADDSNRPKNFDTPAGVAVTAPYYQDNVVQVNLTSLAEGI